MKIQFTKFIFIISLIPFLLTAQEFDDGFLSSLPEDIRSDLIIQSLEKDSLEKTQYRRPSSFIKKPAGSSDRYGSKIFSMMQTSLMPLNEPNFDGDYILDFGDQLELQLVGQKSSTSTLSIKRDGSINIKDIGKIFLSGLSLNNAIDIIKNKIDTTFIGVDSYVSLVNVRDIQIIVAGNVYNPGPYTLNGNSNLFHALTISGGPSDGGSYRSINLIRNNEIIESLDLYQIFMYGKSTFKSRLRSGDVVFVMPSSSLVSIYGAVKRPGIYEVKDDEKLSSIIFYANGITNYADLNDISLMRISNGEVKINKINNLSIFDNLYPEDGDRIHIRKQPYRFIEVKGAVSNPGTYLVEEGIGILGAINRAGGYSKNAYPFGGILENLKTKSINEKALEKLYATFLDNLITTSAGDSTSEEILPMVSILEDLKRTSASGRVNAVFDLAKLEKGDAKDVLLQDGDSILIPEYLDQVYVYGEVASEGAIRFMDGKDAMYYISKMGGLSKNANSKEIFILQPNGESFSLGRKNKFMQKKDTANIFAGTIIFVPRSSKNPYLFTQSAQAYATILGNLGVSLASISVLKD